MIGAAAMALSAGTDMERCRSTEEAAKRLWRRDMAATNCAPCPPAPEWRRALAQLRDPLV